MTASYEVKDTYEAITTHVCIIISYTGEYIYLLLYVDDMLITSKRRSATDKLNDLSSEFEMKDLGKGKKVLGIEIEQDRKGGKVSLT